MPFVLLAEFGTQLKMVIDATVGLLPVALKCWGHDETMGLLSSTEEAVRAYFKSCALAVNGQKVCEERNISGTLANVILVSASLYHYWLILRSIIIFGAGLLQKIAVMILIYYNHCTSMTNKIPGDAYFLSLSLGSSGFQPY